MKYSFDTILKTLAVILVFFFGVQFLYAWNSPTATPTGNNTSAPINMGTSAQGKMGNLGIGTMTPGAKLDVQGTLQVGAGNLDINSTAGDNFIIRTNTNTPNPNFAIGIGDGTGGWANTPIYWNGFLALQKNGGNVGIGTTNPLQRLHVAGNARVDGAIVAPEGTLRDDGGGWVRTYGNTGWYSQSHGGGWYMSDNTWLRTYNSKAIYSGGGTIRSDRDMRAPIFYDQNDTRRYVNPNGWSQMDHVDFHGQVEFGDGYLQNARFNNDANMQGHWLTNANVNNGGRMHLSAGENIYLLSQTRDGRGGVIVGNEWGGLGNLHVANHISVQYWKRPGHNPAYSVDSSGRIRARSFIETSDVRLKKDIKPINDSFDALEKILQLKGVSFNWKELVPDDYGKKDLQFGLIAQDVEKIIPELVATDLDGYKSIDYTNIVPILIEAVKEQQRQIEKLEDQLQDLSKN